MEAWRSRRCAAGLRCGTAAAHAGSRPFHGPCAPGNTRTGRVSGTECVGAAHAACVLVCGASGMFAEASSALAQLASLQGLLPLSLRLSRSTVEAGRCLRTAARPLGGRGR